MQYCIKRLKKKKKVGAISTYGLWEPPCRDSLLNKPLVLSSTLTVCLVETPTCCGHQPFMLMLTWIPLPSPVLIHFDSTWVYPRLWVYRWKTIIVSVQVLSIALPLIAIEQRSRSWSKMQKYSKSINILSAWVKKLFYTDLFSPKVSTVCYTVDFRFKLSNSVISTHLVRNSLIAKLYSSEPALVWQDGFMVILSS